MKHPRKNKYELLCTSQSSIKIDVKKSYLYNIMIISMSKLVKKQENYLKMYLILLTLRYVIGI